MARSTLPEQQSLDKLLIVLLVGGAASILVAAIGGWFLAGKALAPVREAFDRQHAFVGDASHELRTPLAVIRANAEFLQASQPDSVEIADIVSETDRLSALVDSLLALARGGRGDRAQPDVFDLGSVVEQSVEAMTALAAEKQIDLRVDASLRAAHRRRPRADPPAGRDPGGQRPALHALGRLGGRDRRPSRETTPRSRCATPASAYRARPRSTCSSASTAPTRPATATPAEPAWDWRSPSSWWRNTTARSRSSPCPGEGSTFTVRLPLGGATANRQRLTGE